MPETATSKNVTVQTVSIDVIKPYWRNAKTGANVDMLAESIRKYGYTSFIVVDKDFTIIAGHSRYKALKKLGYGEIQVNVVDLPEKEVKELRLLDNKISELNEWDEETLAIELREVNSDVILQAFEFELSEDLLSDTLVSAPVTQVELDRAGSSVGQFENNEYQRKDVMCPHCGGEFQIELK